MSSLASCWCPEEVGLQVTFEELRGWLSSYEGGNAIQTAGEAYEKPLLTRDDLSTGWCS